MEIFFAAGFSRTIFNEEEEAANLVDKTGEVKADADAAKDATAKGINFIVK